MTYAFQKIQLAKVFIFQGKIRGNHVLRIFCHLKCLSIKNLTAPYLDVTEKEKGHCQFITGKPEMQGVCSQSRRLSAVDLSQELGPLFSQTTAWDLRPLPNARAKIQKLHCKYC